MNGIFLPRPLRQPIQPRRKSAETFFKMPRLSQRFIMHAKSRLRCLLLVLFFYFVLCLAIVKFPNPSHIEAISLNLAVKNENGGEIPEHYRELHESRGRTLPSSAFFGKKQFSQLSSENLYIIENAAKCNRNSTSVKKSNESKESIKQILILVSSKPENFAAREAIRNTWAKNGEIHDYQATVMFLIGVKNDTKNLGNITNLRIENENSHDLIVGNFIDDYRSMTSKTKMGFHWFVWNCPKADIVLKTDDDVYIVYSNLYKVVANLQPVSIFGYCTANRSFVSRNPREKSYVSYLDWSEPTVPRYCFGMAYGMDNYLAKIIYQTSSRIVQFPLEDIFVGIAIEASKIRVRFEYVNANYSLHADQVAFGLHFCNRKNSIAIHQLMPSEMSFVHTEFENGMKNPNGCDDFPRHRLEKFRLKEPFERVVRHEPSY
ncbi:beta-1,3-galactosyltransferase 1-like [Convolutriloba macropyga]|uniref:beta-1,3-galactosyltransferase 1-like n=1 Tax=Convolutriloba macropyga TaxID=536237 RepID=UPI003F51F7CC